MDQTQQKFIFCSHNSSRWVTGFGVALLHTVIQGLRLSKAWPFLPCHMASSWAGCHFHLSWLDGRGHGGACKGVFIFLQSKPGGGIHHIFSSSIGWKAVIWPHLRQAEKYSLDTCPEIKRRT